ncbi:hypothetical protein D3C84_1095710 [compost metagenome]
MDQLMGRLLAYLRPQREHHPLRQNLAAEQVEVGAHALLANLKPGRQQVLHAREQCTGVDEQFR